MLFLFLIVSVLLAPVHGSCAPPTNARHHDSRAFIPAEYYTMFDITADILFISGFFFGVLCTIIYGYLKKNKSMRDVTTQYSMDTDIESGTDPTGQHEDEATIAAFAATAMSLINDDAPHGPMAKKRVILEDTNISGPDYVIDIDPDEDVTFSSEEEQENEITNVNNNAPHGMMAEKRDVPKNTSISTPRPDYVVINMEPYEDVTFSSDEEQEDEIINVNNNAPHGTMAEKRDVPKNTNISTPRPDYVVINMEPDEDVTFSSDEEQEDEIMNVNDDAPHGTMAEKKDVPKNTNISTPRPDYVVINMEPYEDVTFSYDKQEDGEHIPPPPPLNPPLSTSAPPQNSDKDLGLNKDIEKTRIFMKFAFQENLAYAGQNQMWAEVSLCSHNEYRIQLEMTSSHQQ